MTQYNITHVELTAVWADISEGGSMGFALAWSAKGIGFGELTFFKADKGYGCHNQCMSPAFIKAVLGAWVDKLELTETWSREITDDGQKQD